MNLAPLIRELCESPIPDTQLTEERLGVILGTMFPDHTFVHDKMVEGSGSRCRPDYYCDDLKLIVEFDGPHHFTKPGRIVADREKDAIYNAMGIRVVRIPYFIQLDEVTTGVLFKGLDYQPVPICSYPHGFIAEKCVTPAEFCSAGLHEFQRWPRIFEFDIERSYWYRINYLQEHPVEVVPFDQMVDMVEAHVIDMDGMEYPS